MTIFLSQKVQSILNRLSAKRRGAECFYFPEKVAVTHGYRINNNESLYEWLVRLADNVKGGIESYIIAENLALEGVVCWENGILSNVNLQVLAVKNGSIEDFYCDPKCADIQSQYYRLEFNLKSPGPLFKEPLPHVHTVPDKEPRFPLNLISKKTMIVDFLEFLHLNYQYDVWCAWAKNIWKNSNDDEKEGIFDVICKAYNTGQISVLETKYKDDILRLKEMLYKEKNEVAARLADIPDTACLLNYNSLVYHYR